MDELKAITTVYNGYKFRSRLEARWAVVFDTLGVRWEYEKEGFQLGDGIHYLPDFWLPDFSYWVEVKGKTLSREDWVKINLLEQKSGNCVAIMRDIPDINEPSGSVGVGKEFPIVIPESQQTTLITDMFSGSNTQMIWDGNVAIICPLCGCENVHIGPVKTKSGNDNYEADWGGRGDAVWISMSCEAGDSWKLLLGFHKGITFASIVDAVEEEHDLLEILANRDRDLVNRAVRAGRQARFEHGEKG